MSAAAVEGGFDYTLYRRNEQVVEDGQFKVPGFTKTGTTIAACLYKVLQAVIVFFLMLK